MSATNPAGGLTPSTTEVLAATIAGAVERQLTQYISAMAQQVEAARQSVESTRNELRAEFEGQLAEVISRLDANVQSSDGQHQALQEILETRLADFAHHQHTRLNDVEAQLLASPAGGSSIDAGELALLREHIDSQSAGAHARIDDLHKTTRRFDEQASAMVQHVNDTTVALSQRMDDGNQALATAVEERLAFVRTTLESIGPEVQRQLSDHATLMAQRLDFTEHKVTDRMLAMEERINESNGTKVAHLEATIGRIGSGFDEAIAALSQRMLELENKQYESADRLTALAEQVSQVDEKAINAVKEQLSAAIGEAMLVRIELDRVIASTDEKMDKSTLRMAEIEALLTDEMDVSASVQLERLDELERALAMLDPNQFVRKVDPTSGSGGSAGANTLAPPAPLTPVNGIPSTSLNHTSSAGDPTSSAEPSLSSF